MNWLRYNFGDRLAYVVTYMLQSTEYNAGDFLRWVISTYRFDTVIKRRKLLMTSKARLIYGICFLVQIGLLAIVVSLFISQDIGLVLVGATVLVLLPYIVSILAIAPLMFGHLIIQLPRQKQIISNAQKIYHNHPAQKIAIVGSYGKTSMKEFLRTILDEKFHVAASPGNINTPIGLSNFANKLDGNEDFLILEFGESRVGDIRELSILTNPNDAVITGISSAHLKTFKTLENIESTLLEVAPFVVDGRLFISNENRIDLTKITNNKIVTYDINGIGDWTVKNIRVSLEGTKFELVVDGQTYECNTKLIGEHFVASLVAAMYMAVLCGMKLELVVESTKYIKPFEHRMERIDMSGAIVIDDTYNGNSSGIAAGLNFMKNIDAAKKIYVTPGLVEQGNKSQEIHEQIGRQIADAGINKVYLIKNSVTNYIIEGLSEMQYSGDITIVDNPIEFYENLAMYTSMGDVVLMQNDWTDNYR